MNQGLIKIHKACISKNLPFATYRLPLQEHSTTYIQTSSGHAQWKSIRDITSERGFIMAPFDTRNGHQYILIKPDLIVDGGEIDPQQIEAISNLPAELPPVWNGESPVVTGRETYMKQVNAIKSSISGMSRFLNGE